MKRIDIATVAQFAGGLLRSGDGGRLVTEVNTDTRSLAAGQVFVALVGERFDAHSFVPQASAAGAAAVIVSQVDAAWPTLDCAVVETSDTLVALQQLAKNYRKWHDPKVICITGSNGKTSTKDLTCALLAPKFKVRATLGNLNNHIGLPLSILTLGRDDSFGVFELGMNHPGEIAPLAEIAKPDGAIITNVGVAHIEYMGSREAIALEKGMLAEAISEEGFVILNANDEFTPSIRERTAAKVVTAGVGCGDVIASDLIATIDGTAFTLDFAGDSRAAFVPIPGEHMVGNAALAAAAAWQSGVEIDSIMEALRTVQLTKGRLETKRIRGVTFLDDSYNANPDSMKAGINTLVGLECPGRRVLVLGRMGELGLHGESGHAEVGNHAGDASVDAVFTVGDEARTISDAARDRGCASTANFRAHEECVQHLREWLSEGDLVLVKGSRSAAMEKIITLFANS